jgi:DNA repair protein RecO (recombination protein O)
LYPEDNYSDLNFLFDLNNGKFTSHISDHIQTDREISNLIHKLMNINFNNMEEVKLGHTDRVEVLKVIIKYFNMHLGGIGEIKSLPVLESVFDDYSN